MINLTPEMMDRIVQMHVDHLKRLGEQPPSPRTTGFIRKTVGTTLIRLGERVAGQRAQAPVPITRGELAAP